LRAGHGRVMVQKDMDQARILKIVATPTFFINGHRRTGSLTSARWGQILDVEIEANRSAILLAPHDSHKPLPLQLKGTTRSRPQSSQ
jgi:hypothetical protein